MAINKVVFGNDTLIDITDTTATASDVQHGKYFYDASGVKIEGTYIPQSVELAAGSADPSESAQHITPPSGYDGFEYFDIGAVSSDYVGSNVSQNSASDVTVSGPTVSIPSGYYSADVSKTIEEATFASYLSFEGTNVGTFKIDSSGLIKYNLSMGGDRNAITKSGYANQNTATWIMISASASYQLSTQAAATYTPSTATQTIPSGVYLTGVQTIEPIPISVDNHRLIVPEGYIGV